MTERIRVEFSPAELIVLEHVLVRLTGHAELDDLLPEKADRQALHDLLCVLEPLSPHAFDDSSGEALADARQQLLDGPEAIHNDPKSEESFEELAAVIADELFARVTVRDELKNSEDAQAWAQLAADAVLHRFQVRQRSEDQPRYKRQIT